VSFTSFTLDGLFGPLLLRMVRSLHDASLQYRLPRTKDVFSSPQYPLTLAPCLLPDSGWSLWVSSLENDKSTPHDASFQRRLPRTRDTFSCPQSPLSPWPDRFSFFLSLVLIGIQKSEKKGEGRLPRRRRLTMPPKKAAAKATAIKHKGIEKKSASAPVSTVASKTDPASSHERYFIR
jgi:hypothetical protein